MRRFACPSCRHEVFFANTACLSCGTPLAYDPTRGIVALDLIWPESDAQPPDADDAAPEAAPSVDNAAANTNAESGPAPCANRDIITCNWTAEPGEALCRSCRHTTLVPDLAIAGNTDRWARIEAAKRPLIRLLDQLGLPLTDAQGQPSPVFELKGDSADANAPRVLTGHDDGTITLNIAEADDDARAAMRTAMGEPYRTLPGHFRHEVGHHYWAVLTAINPRFLDTLRATFGDERVDYGEALAAHYRNGPPQDWAQNHISSYATSHPWEDFAETWAHVLHVLDGLETARAFGLVPPPLPEDLPALVRLTMAELADAWIDLSLAMNVVNETMGHETFYPFVLTPPVIAKMEELRLLIIAPR